MTDDPRLPDLYGRAAELEGEDRARWLAALRGEEPELAAEVERLLAAGAERGARLDTPAWRKLAVPGLDEGAATPARVGPYRIVREIGRGGMGRVFLAEQEGAEFRRTVALKLVDPALLSDEAVRRFRDEVRILAPLAHPGIARFLDGGRAPDGTWFLALEYVEGVDLVEHARRKALAADERIRLFLDVLEAVEHAHRSAVVHRDLKPANILVGADGRPRLLDFGISKLVDPAAGGALATTRTDSRILTPAYASPEQFRGERASVASDVYSLGVVLYELLCGVHPHREASGSRADLERAVLEVEPDPPSTAARRRAEREGGEAARPAPLRWSADIDAICLKALRKEPESRYPSARAFAEDLRRYLEGRPVEARRGGLRYRLVKLVRRRRVELAAAAALLLALAAVGYAASVGLRARRVAAAALASAPAETAEPAEPTPRAFPIRRHVRVSIEELERRFAAEPGSAEAGSELAAALLRLSRAQEAAVVIGRMRQLPSLADDPLVDYTDSLVALAFDEPQRALALCTRALEHALRDGRGELVARIRTGRARVLSDLGREDEALAERELALAAARAAGDAASLARIYNDLAIARLGAGDLAEGERLLELALESTRAADDPVPVGSYLHNLAGIAVARDRPAVAETRYREAIAHFREIESPQREVFSLGDLGDLLRELGRPDEAAATGDEALALARRIGDESSIAYLLYYRALLDLERAGPARVDAAAAEIEGLSRTSGSRAALALAELLRGGAAAARGGHAAARGHLERAARILTDNGEVDWASDARLAGAEVELADGRYEEAARLAGTVAADYAAAGESRFRHRAESVLTRADVRLGRLDRAAARARSLAPLLDRAPTLTTRLACLSALAAVEAASGDRSAARGRLRAAIEASAGAGRELDELRFRLDLAELEIAGGRREAAGDLRALAADGQRLGAAALEARARALLESPR